ncbi:cytochrome P450 [Streptomyces sp. NPDC046862]|uniref:cytochrome P450 family protein n=1 Tax=Streptomyces sp. NPDC046862 TaxID=3154603 RepID=UPI003454BA52
MSNPLQNPEFFANPYPAYAELRGSCPVQKIRTGRTTTSYLVTGYAEARAAFTDPRLSKNATAFFADKPSQRNLHPALSQTMLDSDPPEHTRMRRLVTKAFSTATVQRLRPYIQQVTDELIDAFLPHGRADLVEEFAVPLPVTVICEMLGVPEQDHKAIREWSAELFAAGHPDRIDAATHTLADYMTDLVQAKRRTPDSGLLADLLAARDNGDQLSESEVVSLGLLLLVAGHETTANFIGNAVLALFQHPQALNRLRDHPDLLNGAVDELLRYDNPVNIATFRYTTKAITLGGVHIPAGEPVLISPTAANRDPDRFPVPNRLDLDRDAVRHLAFGRGIHRCVGAPLARAEADIALTTLLRRCPNLQLATPAEQLQWRPTRLVRGLESLPVTFSPGCPTR